MLIKFYCIFFFLCSVSFTFRSAFLCVAPTVRHQINDKHNINNNNSSRKQQRAHLTLQLTDEPQQQMSIAAAENAG